MGTNMYEKFSMKGKVAVITGGAGGLGFKMIEALVQAGSDAAIVDMNGEGARQAAEKLAAYGVRAKGYEMNITDEESIVRTKENIMNDFGTVDVLVNCAAINHHTSIEDCTIEDFSKLLHVNVAGTFAVTKHFGQIMKEKGSGSIVNIASHSGTIVNTPQLQSAYNTSKAAMIHFTRCTASEWAPYNVRCNSVSPGYMSQGMSNVKGRSAQPDPDVQKLMMDMSPMKRVGTPEELAGAVLYLASDAASFTTGIDIMVNGGFHIW
ncbi:MAG: SDR family oxidoreductase [Lachnospiraceae bacterium]|nr:SDR family oxidoreductase [Lachnospiraceae bacterium]